MASDPAPQKSISLLRALANKHRLQVLCALSAGELSVGDLARQIDLSQSALSQHLARLRNGGLVATRRIGQTIFYGIADHEASAMAQALSTIVSRRAGRG